MEETRSGVVRSVRGSVVDVRFPAAVPALHRELRAGDDGSVVIEVMSHLDAETARGIALTSTRGLSRGSRVVDTGTPSGCRWARTCWAAP